MAILKMVKCDNPNCTNVGKPEYIFENGKVNPPYGWIFISGGWFGSGPLFKNLMVCDVVCVGPAIQDFWTRTIEED